MYDGDAQSDAAAAQIKTSGLEVIGVAACESAATADEARRHVGRVADRKICGFEFSDRVDSAGEMNKLWMAARFELGIPTSFVVDRIGHIAFIGHPMDLDYGFAENAAHRWLRGKLGNAVLQERVSSAWH
ncbi:hypothetical protein V7799_00105 [Rhizobium laguerreae]